MDEYDDKGPSSMLLLTKWVIDCLTEDAQGVPLIYTLILVL